MFTFWSKDQFAFLFPNKIPPSKGARGMITLKVYDALGKEVAILVNENKQAGEYEVEWNASDFPSGVYFYQLSADGVVIDTKKMVLMK